MPDFLFQVIIVTLEAHQFPIKLYIFHVANFVLSNILLNINSFGGVKCID